MSQQLVLFDVPKVPRPVANGTSPTPRLLEPECRVSPTGRHQVVDLSSLRYLLSPPFCAWCGPLKGAAPPQRPGESAWQ